MSDLMSDLIQNLIRDRLEIGWSRYGRGLLNSKNDGLDFRQELIEELLDAVIYAAADVVRKTPQVTMKMNITDEGTVKINLKVNHELDRDGNDAVFAEIVRQLNKSYDYDERPSKSTTVLLLCMFGLSSVIQTSV
jgi:hypothetical protein